MESQNTGASNKSNRTLIIAAVVVILLCCCLAIGGFLFYRSGAISALTSYEGLADSQLRTDTMKLIGNYETSANNCDNISLQSARVLSQPGSDGSWVEAWQISACGETHSYNITFTPSAAGGTDIHITNGQ